MVYPPTWSDGDILYSTDLNKDRLNVQVGSNFQEWSHISGANWAALGSFIFTPVGSSITIGYSVVINGSDYSGVPGVYPCYYALVNGTCIGSAIFATGSVLITSSIPCIQNSTIIVGGSIKGFYSDPYGSWASGGDIIGRIWIIENVPYKGL